MITVRIEGAEEAFAKLAKIKSNSTRKSILRKAGRQVVKSAKARIVAQRDLSGAPFAPAADGSGRKLLVGRPKKDGLRRLLKVIEASEDSVTVGWQNGLLSRIAYQQQYGHSEPTKNTRKKVVASNAPATRKQAKSLIDAGYKVRKNGKAYRTPSIKWITENMTMGRAGLILRILQPTQSTGITKIPPRSFLGITDEDLNAIGEILNQEIEAALKA
ncbi:phage virion morphogenesis protein [Methylomonas rapida]|uniref:Phage virion morphogenesis protein n=1 Tax=Methylomonas rapida TaxID=2963939 RepID=A0ABY7GGZ8_9GAMM|nr:phage virion morphogenesis protein [Methylomonas rapida]WAR43726.1 phage virion morphogenesis protein [Methylomonas rapida]